MGIRSRLRRSPLMRRLLQMIGGNSAAQLIVLLAAPIITRLYSPEVFGIQGVFLSAVSLLAPLVALRYPMTIVLARGNREIRQAEQTSVAVSFVTCLLLFLLLIFVREPMSKFLGLETLGWLILFLPAMLFFTAMQEIVGYKAARLNRFKETSIVSVVQAFLINGSRVLGGLLQPVASTLVVISTAGPAVHASLLKWMIRDQRPSKKLPQETLRSLKSFAITHKDFPLYRAPADFMNAASQALPVIILSTFFGPAIAGFYTLARSTLNLPANVLGNAIGNVFYAHFAEKARAQRPLLFTAMRSTLILLLGPGFVVVSICFFAPQLFAFVFGPEWHMAGVYAQWMSIWIAIALANVPSVRLAPVIGKQGVLLASHVFALILRIGSMILAYIIYADAFAVVIAYSLSSAVGNIGIILIMLILTRKFDRINRDNSGYVSLT